MKGSFCEKIVDNGNCLFRSFAKLLENVTYYFAFRYRYCRSRNSILYFISSRKVFIAFVQS
jgi:hypothetical protein